MSSATESGTPVLVVSPADDERVAALTNSLLEAGHPVRVSLDPHQLDHVGAREIVVCLFPNAPFNRPGQQRLLRLLRSRRVLGVVPAESAHDCEPVIDNCSDFCHWPCESGELRLRIARLAALPARIRPRRTSPAPDTSPLHRLIGDCPSFVNCIKQIHRVAPYDAPVLITGETGTGKEIVARAVHYEGPRRDGPFIPVNCGALPENLIEDELFGHERGAYTDANKSRRGVFGDADGGTLFLDEVDALPLNKGQTALLRVLEDQEYRPLGGDAARRVDARIIVATNARLRELVDERRFRADLYYRLNILEIRLPSLRDRGRDIGLLSEYFLKSFSAQYGLDKRLSPEGLEILMQHDWPGNVRELRNFLHREYLQEENTVLCGSLDGIRWRRDLPAPALPPVGCPSPFREAKARAISTFEREYLLQAIRSSHGNIAAAARIAGKERRAFGRLLQKHNIDATSFR